MNSEELAFKEAFYLTNAYMMTSLICLASATTTIGTKTAFLAWVAGIIWLVVQIAYFFKSKKVRT